VSSGGNVPKVKIPVGPGYQVEFSETIRKEVHIATGTVGKITTAKQSEAILKSGKADFVLYARETLRQPNLPLKFAHDLGEDLTWPEQYERAKLPL
jgi:2,4-dienoyl-CoA reductase-like NADH-dependent reductase (Old Yellow Enzyme family)